MKDVLNYSQKEVNENIARLTNILEDKKLKRSELTKEINLKKKQINYWLELDKSQIKLF